jgi:hypothetical protein
MQLTRFAKMSSSITTKQPGAALQNARHAKVLLDRLKRRLNNFTVKNTQNETVGEVQDLKLDPSDSEGYFTLLVLQTGLEDDHHLFSVSSRSLYRIDIPNRTLYAEIDERDLRRPSTYGEQYIDTAEVRIPAGAGAGLQTERYLEENDRAVRSALAKGSVGVVSPVSEPPADADSLPDVSAVPKTVREEVIRLLEEKLNISRNKRKAGEVIIRKTVETRMVEVPVRWEKLIIEQVGDEQKRLAEVDLSQGEILGIELVQPGEATQHPTVKGQFISLESARDVLEAIAGTIHHRCKLIKIEIFLKYWDMQRTYYEFTSPRVASHVLDAIAKTLHHRCNQINVELSVDSWDIQRTYQEWFDQYGKP